MYSVLPMTQVGNKITGIDVFLIKRNSRNYSSLSELYILYLSIQQENHSF